VAPDRADAAASLAAEIDADISAVRPAWTDDVRRVRRAWSRRLRGRPPAEVVAVALALRDRHRWVAYELVYEHPGGLEALDARVVEALGQGLGSWDGVDAFGRYISGPAWGRGVVPDAVIRAWTTSSDRWWRRAALVSTVPLNLRAAGGTGDTVRTIDICERLVDDRDDMVVKALSWALRALVPWDPGAVRDFLVVHQDEVAARVRREVTTKLETGRKQRPRA
jgi:3-methyladenine DNA glycosylase AlkD